MTADVPRHTYEMGFIGNCAFSALVDKNATVKWLCWPRFDSDFVFGSILGKGLGEFSITPRTPYQTQQVYLENTNILSTSFKSEEGDFEVIDFAPRFFDRERPQKPLMLFRKVKYQGGRPRLKIQISPVGCYGQFRPQVVSNSHELRFLGLGSQLQLTTNVPLCYILEERSFVLSHDLYLVLSWGLPLETPLISTCEEFLRKTQEYWWTWVERCTLPKVFTSEVIRSALALKLHQYEDTGAIIAATTTSLPEVMGGKRNWDYRYCWLRDTYYSLSALNSIGHFDEMERYSHFIENLGFDSPREIQPVYTLSGDDFMEEFELALEGYLTSQPVRWGNAAAKQTQNDAYGQILLSLFYLYSDRRIALRHRRYSPKIIRSLLLRIAEKMHEPDAGIWEFRGRRAVHSYTLLFHWAGSAAAQKLGRILGDPTIEELSSRCRAQAHKLLESCFDAERGVYTQSLGQSEIDASLLQMISLGYFDDTFGYSDKKQKERARRHIDVIEETLGTSRPGFIKRYLHQDDFGKQETAFLACGFWLVEALILTDQTARAIPLFKELLKTQNHLGLLSEGADPDSLSQWGNFPQAYSHVGLINCAFALDRKIKQPKFLLDDTF